jgi:hypothetical protein
LFDVLYGYARPACQFFGELSGALFELILRIKAVYQAQAKGFLGTDRFPGDHHFERFCGANQPWQPLRTAVSRKQAESNFRQAQLVVAFCSETEVACQGDLQPASQRMALNLCDVDFAAIAQLVQRVVREADHLHVTGSVVRHECLDIRASREELWQIAFYDNDAYIFVGVRRFNRVVEIVHEPDFITIGWRPVQCYQPDFSGFFKSYNFIIHRF